MPTCGDKRVVYRSELQTAHRPHAMVTGIQGFTGKYVGAELERSGYLVTGTRHPQNTRDGQADTRCELDICSLANCREIIDELRPTHLVHLAARSFVGDADDIGFYENNVIGTLNLLKACADVNHEPKSILIASSANVYGNASGVISETVSPQPVNHYGASKLAMENLVRTWSDRLPIIITRPFNYTGLGQSDRFLVPKIVSHFRKKLDHIELGNLDVVRDFSDVRYVATVYRKLLENPEAVSQTVNICSGRGHSLDDILELASRISGHELEVKVNPDFVRSNEIKLLVGDATKLQMLAPGESSVQLEKTVEWMLA